MIGLDDLFSRLETALEAGGIAWWEIEFPSGVIFFSDLRASMIGYKPSDFTHYGQFMELIHPNDRDRVNDALEGHVSGKLPTYEASYRIKHKNGNYISMYERGKVVVSRDDVKQLSGIVIGIGGQKSPSIQG